MSTELAERLRQPFEPADLEWRVTRSGMRNDGQGPWAVVAPYVNRAALINRLNQVCGLDGWQTDTRMQDGHVAVGVGIRVRHVYDFQEQLVTDEAWVWRWDGTGHLEADPPHFTPADAGKGDFSMAFKRACEQFGIATYLREVTDAFAIFNTEGRYRAKIGGKVHRWDPPGLEGTPSYPGTIPSAPAGSNGRSDEGQEQNRKPAEKPEELTEEKREERIDQAREAVRAFMRRYKFKPYHLDAVVQVHEKLKMRYSSGDELASKAGLEDWLVLEDLTKRSKGIWEDAPKELAKDFPTGPERVELLRDLMKKTSPSSGERVTIESAISVGWNDAVEYWIAKLEERT